LEIARKLDVERKEIEEATAQRIMEEHRFKDAEKEKQINDMRKQIAPSRGGVILMSSSRCATSWVFPPSRDTVR
jgi:ATP-dependent RNA circularization protein (DNA/RNA ligase family)